MVTTHDIPRAVPRDDILTSRGACRYTSVNPLTVEYQRNVTAVAIYFLSGSFWERAVF